MQQNQLIVYPEKDMKNELKEKPLHPFGPVYQHKYLESCGGRREKKNAHLSIVFQYFRSPCQQFVHILV
jgi:hypothetical protein